MQCMCIKHGICIDFHFSVNSHTDEFQVDTLPGGNADKLNLSGSYILKVSGNSLELFTANGALPTNFHCSLASISSVHCTATYMHGSKSGLLMIQTSR